MEETNNIQVKLRKTEDQKGGTFLYKKKRRHNLLLFTIKSSIIEDLK